jgi:hypothetical protein
MWEIRPNKACIAQIWFDWDAPRYGVKRLRNPISGECDIVKVVTFYHDMFIFKADLYVSLLNIKKVEASTRRLYFSMRMTKF